MEEALHYVSYEIEYKSDPPEVDYWQTPEETEKFRIGDCEDKAILLMYLLDEIGVKSMLLLVKSIITQVGHARD